MPLPMERRERKAKTGDPRKVVGYLRASTDKQELSPEAQRAALRAWCESRRCELVAVHEDPGVSGAAPLDKGPALLAALDSLKLHGAGVLLAARRDRIARDVVNAAVIERMAEKAGAKVMTADGAVEGDGPDGWLMKTIKDAFAQYELLIIRARTRAGLAVKKARNERTGGVPFGYRVAEDGKHLEPIEQEQAIIVEARTLREQGLTLLDVGRRLEETGRRPRNGGCWHATQIARLCARAA